VRKAREALARRLQEQLDAVFVWDSGAVYLGFEHQTLGVHQQMALAAFHSLGGAEAALCASHGGGPSCLGVNDACAGVGIPAKAASQTLAQLKAFKRSQVPSIRHLLNHS
jgi:hypothetical protein